jgi:hypothetical protein
MRSGRSLGWPLDSICLPCYFCLLLNLLQFIIQKKKKKKGGGGGGEQNRKRKYKEGPWTTNEAITLPGDAVRAAAGGGEATNDLG